MSAEGKYVRINQFSDGVSDIPDDELVTMEQQDAGRFVRAPKLHDNDCEEQNNSYETDEYDDYRNTVDLNRENEMLKQQLAEMQKAIDRVSSLRKGQQEFNAGLDAAEDSWRSYRTMTSSLPGGNGPSIRWDQMKPFPKNVPANKMWEEWIKFIENFEISASLSNTNDPVPRSQLLYLFMSDDLQSIVRAAKLRPDLNDRQCYKVFIKNVEDHLRAMTDTAAEHEAFSCMQQDRTESVMSFHARLMAKVRLCQYSANDQERFVRAQLLKGMFNRELARTARTYGHDTNLIVQAATRDEAYQREASQATRIEDDAVNQVGGRMSTKMKRERRSDSVEFQNKRFRQDKYRSTNRRELCSRCNKWMHRNRPCPALQLQCHTCGKFGHFAVVCKTSRVNSVQRQELPQEAKTNNGEVEVKKNICSEF